jgi:RecB family endonuclease NucS
VLGLTDVSKHHVEYRFQSGDRADLVFEHRSGVYTVVEVETTTPLPGAHQAIKYRALLCAQKGFPLTSQKVRSILAAWSIPTQVADFCTTYGIGVSPVQKK